MMNRSLTIRAFAMFVAAGAILQPTLAASEGILGDWARGDGNARVRIVPCGGALCAIDTWIKNVESGEHVGDRLVMKVSGGDSAMSGTAYDPQRKLSYSLEINYGGQSMQTRGCVLAGIICKSISWSRVSR
jgi:uncharacterized protein (DUF2147 family)